MDRPRRRRLGIRARVVASFLVLLLAAEVISLVVMHQVGAVRIEDQADQDLDAAAEDLRTRLDAASSVGTAEGPALTSVLDDFLQDRPARDDRAYLVYLEGRPYALTAAAPVALDELPLGERWASLTETASGDDATPAGPMRWLAVPIVTGDQVAGVLVATGFLQREQDALVGTVTVVGVVTGLVLVGACLLAWGAAGRALAPLHRLAGTARTVSTGTDLSTRLEIDSRDEVATVATALNGMLDRLEVAFDSQQRFLDDAGHELRTPITIVRGHLELLDDDPEIRAREVALVLDELDRMDRLVRDLRLLARSERPDFLERTPVDASALVEEVARKAGAMADRDWRTVTPPAGSTVRLDRHRVTEALLNLVDNAVEATPAGGIVEVGGSVDDEHVQLWIRDEGIGIDPDDVDGLLRRGGTAHRRPGGTGLGLPIVATIAAAHGGSVRVESELGSGTRIALVLPRDRGARP